MTLARKVETEIFRPADVPKGAISVNVNDGVVELRGEIADQKQIDELGDSAKQGRRRQGRPQPAPHRQHQRRLAARNTAGRSGVYDSMLSYSSLSGALAAERERAIREKARDAWRRRQRGELKLRDATDDDAADLLRLARLDSQGRPPAGRMIVAVDRGVVVAAMSVESRRGDRRPVPLDRADRGHAAAPRRADAPPVGAQDAAVAAPSPGARRLRLEPGGAHQQLERRLRGK